MSLGVCRREGCAQPSARLSGWAPRATEMGLAQAACKEMFWFPMLEGKQCTEVSENNSLWEQIGRNAFRVYLPRKTERPLHQ